MATVRLLDDHELSPEAAAVFADILLSNMPAPYAQHLEDTHGFLALFRGGVFSARAGLCKPEAAIYEHCARELGLVPERTLFIDDVQHNVDAARAAGWQALRFESPAQLGEELRGRGLI